MSVPLLLSKHPGSLEPVAKETVYSRLLGLIDEAVAAGRFKSRADFLDQAGLSSGYLGEFAERTARNEGASMTLAKASVVAGLLGTSVAALTGAIDDQEPPVIDKYPGRAWAIAAARNLKLPESAIQLVLKEDPGRDPGRWYWFRRIEAEAERIRPASQG